ncbi:SIMPL domain-containing protein [Patescibacteria group bacterium]|nr:SIMPL domain-containing protein [Patescibacteria group bacterium]
MPVKKKPLKPAEVMPEKKSCCSLMKCGCNEMVKKLFITLLGILLVYVVVLVGSMIRNNLQEYDYIGKADRMERTITIEAEGKVTATPDIAVTTMGMVSEGVTVAEAQEKNTLVMNDLTAKLKNLGIDEDDLQTMDYNIYPRYDYTEKDGRVLEGYEVHQSLKVKIRDLDLANSVLALAGEVGANSVSGLDFTLDDDEVYKAQARDEALLKVVEKAKILSQSLGVGLVKVVAYDEYESGANGIPIYKAYSESAYGIGGGLPTPDVQAGSTDVMMNVAVTFEIR